MSDGVDEHANRPAQRGSKLRHQGDELGNKPKYSGSMDYSIGGTTLNSKPKMDESQHCCNSQKADHDLRGETGLITKEPLS